MNLSPTTPDRKSFPEVAPYPTSGSSHLVLEGLNDLVKLVGPLDGDRVGLVFIRIENGHVVVTRLVLVANLRGEAFRLILNTFVVRLEDAADAFL